MTSAIYDLYLTAVRHVDREAERGLDLYLRRLKTGSDVLVAQSERPEGSPFAQAFEHVLARAPSLVSIPAGAASPARTRSVADPHVAFETSGTSAGSKCVLYRRDALLACGTAISERLSLRDTGSSVSFVPPHYAYGLSIVHSHALANSRVLFSPMPRSSATLAALLDNHNPELVYMLPIQAAELASIGVELPGVRAIAIAGGALATGTALELAKLHPSLTLHHMYGQAELGPRVSIWTGDLSAYEYGSAGSALNGVDLRVGSNALQGNEDATLQVSSPYRMEQYLGRETPPLIDGAWWDTRDRASLRSSGLFLSGRADRSVKVLGTLVDLTSIESVLNTMPEVSVAAVTAMDRGPLGSIPIAHVVLAESAAPDVLAIKKVLHDQLGDAGTITRVRLTQAIPRTAAGKVDYRNLEGTA
jgi:acyl-coenzyme A synthetase/AMP-(fatty) acid ligase